LVFCVTLIAPLLAALLVQKPAALRPSVDVLMSWPVLGAYHVLIGWAGFAAAFAMGVYAWMRPGPSWGRWLPAAFLTMLQLAGGAPAFASRVSLEQERIVLETGWPAFERDLVPLSEVASVHINCGARRVRRGSSVPTLFYQVVLRDGHTLDLSKASGRSSWSVSNWLLAVDEWDRRLGPEVARRIAPPTPECLERLRSGLRPSAADAALRLLGQNAADQAPVLAP
jgi:hypothetical protein